MHTSLINFLWNDPLFVEKYHFILSKEVVLLLLIFSLLLPLWESVIVLCFVVRYFMSLLVLQSF